MGPTDPFQQGITDLSQRLRVLEERYTVLRRKGQLTDENVVTMEQELRDTFARLSSELTELRRLFADIDDKMDRFLEQVKQAAPREDVLVLKKYVEMWDPVRYLTRDEARRLLEKA